MDDKRAGCCLCGVFYFDLHVLVAASAYGLLGMVLLSHGLVTTIYFLISALYTVISRACE